MLWGLCCKVLPLAWRTASTQWFVKAMIWFVYGLQPELDGLHVRPCLPANWQKCGVVKMFRRCTYRVSYERTGVRALSVDGRAWPLDAALPAQTEVQVTV